MRRDMTAKSKWDIDWVELGLVVWFLVGQEEVPVMKVTWS